MAAKNQLNNKKPREVMPTYPEKDSETKSSSPPPDLHFRANVPVVHSISGMELERRGWAKTGMTWHKDGKTIIYDGAQWKQDGKTVIQFFEDLQ